LPTGEIMSKIKDYHVILSIDGRLEVMYVDGNKIRTLADALGSEHLMIIDGNIIKSFGNTDIDLTGL
jgi:hypothetical protein